MGAGRPSLSRRAASLCTAVCGPLSSVAISEGGKNNGDLKGSEVCVGGGICVHCHRDRRVNKHTCAHACLPTYMCNGSLGKPATLASNWGSWCSLWVGKLQETS